jgi:hypothetical protein
MKIVFAIAVVLVAINFWDQSYNNGTLTKAAYSLAEDLAHAFGM